MRMIRKLIISPILVDKENSHKPEKGIGDLGTRHGGSE
jgi:hypothetical protein